MRSLPYAGMLGFESMSKELFYIIMFDFVTNLRLKIFAVGCLVRVFPLSLKEVPLTVEFFAPFAKKLYACNLLIFSLRAILCL